jgi:hypothetical protein
MKSCIQNIKKVFNTFDFTINVEMCEFGCAPFRDEATLECSQCKTPRNKTKPTYLKMVSIEAKVAQMLSIPEIREDIASYRSNFNYDGVYRDVFSGRLYNDLKNKKDMFKNKHDVIIGLCVDGFSSKSGNQSLVMISVIVFSINPSQR